MTAPDVAGAEVGGAAPADLTCDGARRDPRDDSRAATRADPGGGPGVEPRDARASTTVSTTVSTTRLEAFSDGVFAIIITLLALDLRVPAPAVVGGGDLGAALAPQWPSYLAFTVSFLLVGVVWANHHTMFHLIARADHGLVVLNTLFLLCAAVLPFTTALLADYTRGTAAQQRLAALVYSGALAAGGACFNLIWWHAARAGLAASPAAARRLRVLGRSWLLGPALYAAAFGLAFVSVPASRALYVVLLVYFGLPARAVAAVARRLARHRGTP